MRLGFLNFAQSSRYEKIAESRPVLQRFDVLQGVPEKRASEEWRQIPGLILRPRQACKRSSWFQSRSSTRGSRGRGAADSPSIVRSECAIGASTTENSASRPSERPEASPVASIILVDLDPIAVRVLKINGPYSVGPRVFLPLFTGEVAKRRASVFQVADRPGEVGRRNAKVGGYFDECIAEVALDQMDGLSPTQTEPSNVRFACAAFDLGQEEDLPIELRAAFQVSDLQ